MGGAEVVGLWVTVTSEASRLTPTDQARGPVHSERPARRSPLPASRGRVPANVPVLETGDEDGAADGVFKDRPDKEAAIGRQRQALAGKYAHQSLRWSQRSIDASDPARSPL